MAIRCALTNKADAAPVGRRRRERLLTLDVCIAAVEAAFRPRQQRHDKGLADVEAANPFRFTQASPRKLEHHCGRKARGEVLKATRIAPGLVPVTIRPFQ